TELESEHYHIAAHKLIPQQGIGVHTDRPQDGSETHRLVIHLNRGFVDSYGGHLIFFDDQKGQRVRKIIRPLHNSAVAFESSARSYHAVSNVLHGIRYSLVFSLWRRGAEREGQGVPQSGHSARSLFSFSDDVTAQIGEQIRYLDSLGADTILHDRGTLL